MQKASHLEPETSGKKTSSSDPVNAHPPETERLKVTTPEGTQYNIPKPIHGKYVAFSLRLGLTKDWASIQLIYSLPPRTRSRMIRDMLRIVVNAAHIWLEKQPTLQLRHGKKLTEEQRRKLLRTKLKLG
jgi:hypothetical protein